MDEGAPVVEGTWQAVGFGHPTLSQGAPKSGVANRWAGGSVARLGSTSGHEPHPPQDLLCSACRFGRESTLNRDATLRRYPATRHEPVPRPHPFAVCRAPAPMSLQVRWLDHFVPCINMGELLAWGVHPLQKYLLFWDALNYPSYPDAGIMNWIVGSGGRVVRIDWDNPFMIVSKGPATCPRECVACAPRGCSRGGGRWGEWGRSHGLWGRIALTTSPGANPFPNRRCLGPRTRGLPSGTEPPRVSGIWLTRPRLRHSRRGSLKMRDSQPPRGGLLGPARVGRSGRPMPAPCATRG